MTARDDYRPRPTCVHGWRPDHCPVPGCRTGQAPELGAPHRTAPPGAGEDTRAQDTGPDWRGMTRGDFDAGAPPDTLFELEPAAVRAVDLCGTADMLELLEDGA